MMESSLTIKDIVRLYSGNRHLVEPLLSLANNYPENASRREAIIAFAIAITKDLYDSDSTSISNLDRISVGLKMAGQHLLSISDQISTEHVEA